MSPMRRTITIALATVLVLLGVGAAGMVLMHDEDGSGWGWSAMTTSGHMGGDSGSTSGFGPWMHGSARTADEAGYLSEMVAHHREAILAAGELSRSDRPEMRAFGRDVVATQSEQVRLMGGWLAAWYPDEPAASYEPMMRDLSGLSGDELDRAFLEDMIGHHMAAVMMSQQLLVRGLDEHAEVGDLARTIRDDQMDEIAWMRSTWSRMAP